MCVHHDDLAVSTIYRLHVAQPVADTRKRMAFVLAIVSGVLLLSGQFSGAARWQAIIDTLSRFIEVTPSIQALFLAIIAIASLGGIAVIIAGLLIARGQSRLPRLLILLGTGFGILSLLMYIVPQAIGGRFPLIGESSAVTIGVVLSIVARSLAKG